MTGSDDEFDDFLKRRKPVFRSPDDMFEPPAELDRVVLRQRARGHRVRRPMRVFRDPRWAMPVALAATLLLAFTMLVLRGLAARSRRRCPKSPCRTSPSASMCRRPKRRWQSAPPRSWLTTSAPSDESSADAVRGGPATLPRSAQARVGRTALRRRLPRPWPPASPRWWSRRLRRHPPRFRPGGAMRSPGWRKSQRLRDAGDTARADAELAEYKRQQRAYAGAPDR